MVLMIVGRELYKNISSTVRNRVDQELGGGLNCRISVEIELLMHRLYTHFLACINFIIIHFRFLPRQFK